MDPLNNTAYTYSLAAETKEYSLAANYEGDSLAYEHLTPASPPWRIGTPLVRGNYTCPLLRGCHEVTGVTPELLDAVGLADSVSAASWNPTLTYVKGTYNGIAAKVSTGGLIHLLAVPNILVSSGVTSLTGSTAGFLVHGQSNSWGLAFVPKLLFASGALPSTTSERITFASGVADAYANTVLASNSNIKVFVAAAGNTGALASLGGNFVSTEINGGGAVSSVSNTVASVTNGKCGTASGTTIGAYPTGSAACEVGTITGTGFASNTYSWICSGSNGGLWMNCSATRFTYTTWNPSMKWSSLTLSSSDLIVTNTVADKNFTNAVRATHGKTTGKYYFEITMNAITTNYADIGIVNETADILNATNWNLENASKWSCFSTPNGIYGWGFRVSTLSANNGDVLRIAVDVDAHTIWFGINNSWANLGDPSNNLNPISTGLTGTIYPAVALRTGSPGGQFVTANFGSGSFSYPVPTGFTPWWPIN